MCVAKKNYKCMSLEHIRRLFTDNSLFHHRPSVATNVEIPDKVDFADIEKVKLIKESLVY